jgi:hypothetical protein
MGAFIRVDEKPHHVSPSLSISLARASHACRPSYAGVVITERVGKLDSSNSVSKPYPPAPLGSELPPDAQGFLTDTRKGIAEDMAQDLLDGEQILTATQGQTSAYVFGATIKTAAWKSKPSWAEIARATTGRFRRNSRKTRHQP